MEDSEEDVNTVDASHTLTLSENRIFKYPLARELLQTFKMLPEIKTRK